MLLLLAKWDVAVQQKYSGLGVEHLLGSTDSKENQLHPEDCSRRDNVEQPCCNCYYRAATMPQQATEE